MGPRDATSFGWLASTLSQKYDVSHERAVAALRQAIGDFMVGRTDNGTFWTRVGSSLGVVFEQKFQDTIWQQWHGATPVPEMEVLVREVKAMGLRVVVFSNIIPPGAAKIREIAGYEGFDAEVLSCELDMKKPGLEIYQKAIDAAQCSPEECVFIDDKEVNLAPARDLGMTTILALDSAQMRKDLYELLG